MYVNHYTRHGKESKDKNNVALAFHELPLKGHTRWYESYEDPHVSGQRAFYESAFILTGVARSLHFPHLYTVFSHMG